MHLRSKVQLFVFLFPLGIVVLEKAFIHGQFEPEFLSKLSRLVSVIEPATAQNASSVPSLYVLEVSLDTLEMVELCRRINHVASAGVLIVLNRKTASKYHNQIRRSGFTGAISSTCSEEELATAVYRVAAGVSFIDPTLELAD